MCREKQIEEMAKELCGMNIACKDCRLDKLCLARNSADILYNADYRKQSEGEWYVNYMMSKKPSKRGRTIQYTTYTCSVCEKPNGRKKSKFCPNCGAKMKGGAE